MQLANQPPIYRDAKKLVVQVEQAVKQFARYNRYSLGADLREQAFKVLRLLHRACRTRDVQTKQLKNVLYAVDDVKLTLQIAKELHMFQSFAVFEQLAELVQGISKQCVGWLKSLSLSPEGKVGAKGYEQNALAGPVAEMSNAQLQGVSQ